MGKGAREKARETTGSGLGPGHEWKAQAIAQAVGSVEEGLGALNDRHRSHGPSQPRDDSVAAVATPMDVPIQVRLHRLVDKKKIKKGEVTATGFTLEVDDWSFGVKVFVRHSFKDGTLKVFIEDDEGMSLVQKYQIKDG